MSEAFPELATTVARLSSAYADLRATCRAIDAARLVALDERNQARAEAEKYRTALEGILEPTGLDAAPAYAELRRIAREALRK